ncbi:FAD-dependent monooxygenase [Rhodococcus sp. USK13]|uniref:FAD-dependent monooxygenase n=1 Tax=Rhodococcus sp. USK13 TaxID=2806442 RepID=UPI001BCE0958|nr:FAD-dependent monooxygenase [Rhodococcus sp. USK13]
MHLFNPNGEQSDVLVAGAGPTGLAVALTAHDHGATVRVLDRRPHSRRPSRAFLVHPRTLEVLRPHGVTGAIVGLGQLGPRMHVHSRGRSVSVTLGNFRLPDTPYPHLLLVRQADVEAVLCRALGDRGIEVEWDTAVQRYELDPAHGVVLTQCGAQQFVSRYLVGCDGRSSTVRAAAGIDWRGAPYRCDVLLADIDVTGGDVQTGVAHVFVRHRGLAFLLPLGERARWRLVTAVPAHRSSSLAGDVHPQTLLDELGAGCSVTEVAWSQRVPIEHRLAARFQHGPVFLAGDAAHAFSPAGGQGMNAGLQDAVNLGWKLASAARCRLPDGGALLRSYEEERRPVARRVLALTHLLLWWEAGTDPLSSCARGAVAAMGPHLLPRVLPGQQLETHLVRLLSQLRWDYRRSVLSIDGGSGSPVEVSAGQRLPDEQITVDGAPHRLHDLTAAPGMHVLLCRDTPWSMTSSLDGEFVRVHRVHSWPGAGVVIVRPDGYVGFRSPDSRGIEAWLDMVGAGNGI